MSISVSVYYGWKRSLKYGCSWEINLEIMIFFIAFIVSWFYKTFIPSNILVIIFHICTCDDITLVNERSIVSWKYMKSNKKCVFNVNFQYLHQRLILVWCLIYIKYISFNIFVIQNGRKSPPKFSLFSYLTSTLFF
jgi:hypothetical protein